MKTIQITEKHKKKAAAELVFAICNGQIDLPSSAERLANLWDLTAFLIAEAEGIT